MHRFTAPSLAGVAVLALATLAAHVSAKPTVGASPWGSRDEIGRLHQGLDPEREDLVEIE